MARAPGHSTLFPTHSAPSPAACARAVAGLSALHGTVQRPEALPAAPPTLGGHGDASSCGQTPKVLDALFATILSQNTTQKNSTAAMASLMEAFGGDYHAMRAAGTGPIARAIYQGGLSAVKSRVMLGILDALTSSPGGLSLEHLHGMDDDAAKNVLMAFDGVGAKTASCVLLFCLNRESFAVDTHVHRIAKRLGWVPEKASRDQAHAHLEVRVPAHLKYPLHVLLVTHGKSCPECAANQRPQRAPLGPCPLRPVPARARLKHVQAQTLAKAGRPLSTPTHHP